MYFFSPPIRPPLILLQRVSGSYGHFRLETWFQCGLILFCIKWSMDLRALRRHESRWQVLFFTEWRNFPFFAECCLARIENRFSMSFSMKWRSLTQPPGHSHAGCECRRICPSGDNMHIFRSSSCPHSSCFADWRLFLLRSMVGNKQEFLFQTEFLLSSNVSLQGHG